jgi:alpha-ketoglutarate-dependent taurine dioxygenase
MPTAIPEIAAAGLTPAEAVARLDENGALLLRGFAPSIAHFETFTSQICTGFHRVGTRQGLIEEGSDGYTTRVYQSNFTLLGHAEGGYRPYPPPPEVCFFLCAEPPVGMGGETTVVDGVAMLAEIPPALRKRLECEGVVYQYRWARARWQVEFGVSSEAELRALLSARDDVIFELENDVLLMRYHASAITRCRQGLPVFANALLAHLPRIEHPAYRNRSTYCHTENRVFFGGGEELDRQSIDKLIEAHDRALYRHNWSEGDLLILDNSRFMHGRELVSEDGGRLILTRFGALPKCALPSA